MSLLPAVRGPVDVATIDSFVARSAAIREAAEDPAEVTELIADLNVLVALLRKAPEVAGLAAVEAEKRRAEVRLHEITVALQPQVDGLARPGAGVPRTLARDARRMAANKAVVEQVIASSDDASPPTRRKVKKAIDDAEGKGDGHVVTLHLSDATWLVVSARAGKFGESVGEYLTRLADRLAARNESAPRHPKAKPVPSGCAHAKRSVKGGGIVCCDACGALRGPSGTWRLPA